MQKDTLKEMSNSPTEKWKTLYIPNDQAKHLTIDDLEMDDRTIKQFYAGIVQK